MYKLHGTIQEMEKYTKEQDTEKIIQINAQFHMLIRTFAKNNYMSKQIEAIHSFDRHFRKIALSHVDELGRALKEHQQIYEKIAARDPEGAEASIRTHIQLTTMRVKDRTS